MKCVICGSDKVIEKVVDKYEYVECGLRGVFLQSIFVYECGDCEEREIIIPDIQNLHREISLKIARKEQRLLPTEVKFLRKYLGLSGRDFASFLRVKPETVSRWENPKRESEHIGESSEMLLRALIIGHFHPIENYDEVSHWGKKARASMKAVFSRREETWKDARVA